jgi:hypothetical protein
MGYVQLLLIALAMSIVCAVVLFRAARARGRRPWLWGVVGFGLNIVGLMIWYMIAGPPRGSER